MTEAMLGMAVAVALAIIGATWKIAKGVGDVKSAVLRIESQVAEVRRDVDRHEGLHTEAGKSRERQGRRIGQLEATSKAQADVCAERHQRAPVGGL